MSKVTIDTDSDLVKHAKAIVKEAGFQWKFYVTKAVEKALTELVETGDVEKIIR
jgi:predicted O-methyltransferase YrrM